VAASRNSSEERWYLIEKPVENYCLVEFSGISLNQQLQKATLFDLAEEKARATHKVLCVNVQIDKKTDLLNVAIKDRLERKKDVNHKKLESWAALVCAIESIKHGLPIGTKFNNNYEIFNMIYDHYFDFIGPLIKAINLLDDVKKYQGNNSWNRRFHALKEGHDKKGSIPELQKGATQLIGWLYPELSKIPD
jgi:hypothetical protein